MSHSPRQAALIAGASIPAFTAASHCLIRRYRRRSLRIATLDCGDVLCVVSFAVKNGAHCGSTTFFSSMRTAASHSPRPTALIAGSKNIMRRLWEPVTFAVKNGAHCGDDAWLRKGQVRRSHSPPQAALIAGIFPAPSNSSDSCLIRRYKRRSLRECRYSLSVTVPVVSHSLPQAALIAGHFAAGYPPPRVGLIRRQKRRSLRDHLVIVAEMVGHVTFAARCGVNCGEQDADTVFLIHRSHSPPRAALIAGRDRVALACPSSDLIRRLERRSLRDRSFDIAVGALSRLIRRYKRRSLRDGRRGPKLG